MQNYVHKVCPVILRRYRGHWQILAFRHPKAGTQLIKGTLELGERPEVGVLRELAEESGIAQATVVTKIGELTVPESEQIWHIYLCKPTVDPPEHWSHFTSDGGGLTFQFFWHPLVERGDECWQAHFRRALAFIYNWQGESYDTNSV